MKEVFADTSFWYALAVRRDPHHEEAKRHYGRGFPLLVSNAVFAETANLLTGRQGKDIAIGMGRSLLRSDKVSVLRLTSEDEGEAWRLFCKYRDQAFSFTDCTSFALMRRLGVRHALAFDRDFAWMGFRAPEAPPGHDV